jgi:UDP-N-acetylglucosamine transferase subunit ALG13
MIFVITGSQKFQFNRLLKKIDELVAEGKISEKVFAQIGYSDYIPHNYEYKDFLGRDEFAQIMSECTIVITHGGTGAIIGAVKQGKKVIAVPRLAKFKEHVDDHQVQLLKQFEEMQIICSCYDIENLEKYLLELEDMSFISYKSNTQTIIEDIEVFLYETHKRK